MTLLKTQAQKRQIKVAIEGLSDRTWLLLPGTLCTGLVFDGFLDRLGVANSARTLVMMDRPSIEDYRVDFEGLDRDTIICGFSLGAIVAAHFADSVNADGLIFFGLNPYADDPAKAPSRHALEQDVLAKGGSKALKNRLPDVFGSDPSSNRSAICKMADDCAPFISAQTQLALSRPGALPALERSNLPVLVATGTHDQATPIAQGYAAAHRTPRGEFCELVGLGHFALMEDPDACATVVKNWHEARHDPR